MYRYLQYMSFVATHTALYTLILCIHMHNIIYVLNMHINNIASLYISKDVYNIKNLFDDSLVRNMTPRPCSCTIA